MSRRKTLSVLVALVLSLSACNVSIGSGSSTETRRSDTASTRTTADNGSNSTTETTSTDGLTILPDGLYHPLAITSVDGTKRVLVGTAEINTSAGLKKGQVYWAPIATSVKLEISPEMPPRGNVTTVNFNTWLAQVQRVKNSQKLNSWSVTVKNGEAVEISEPSVGECPAPCT